MQDENIGGPSRRSLFKASGGGLAAFAVVGLTGGPASAAPAKPTVGALVELGPHTMTSRTPGFDVRGQAPSAIRILPINRAAFLAGALFDLRVEAAGVDPKAAKIEISVEGPKGPEPILHSDPISTSSVAGSLEVTYRDVTYPTPGTYTVRARVTNGGSVSVHSVDHEVVAAKNQGKKAKNVIFFLGDGMGQAAITGARILSKGITEGKYNGLLEMDRMEARGLVGTSGADSIATDSANSMSAYMTGHKTSVNAMGVYESNEPNPNKHPRVETMAELLKRSADMAIGVVTTAEIQDATPAAVWAHTRRRSEYLAIMDQVLDPSRTPDVLMGGGLASLIPQSQKGSKRKDERNLVNEFRTLGYTVAMNGSELAKAVSGRAPEKLLGQFHLGNMNVYLDRQAVRNPAVLGDFPDQPNLMEMTAAALKVLEKKENGFFLMVEGASIDKQEHPLDGPRALYDTIEFDKAIGIAKKWAEEHGDTLVVVTADHNHSMSIVGTHDRRENQGRPANGVYGDAGFPTYVDANGDGFPDDPNPEVGLFFGWSNHPDHTDGFTHNPVPVQPALMDKATGKAVPNPKHQPGAELQQGNLPFDQTNCVHCVDDVAVVASGPGAAGFNRFMDNTEIFFGIADALALKVPVDRKLATAGARAKEEAQQGGGEKEQSGQ